MRPNRRREEREGLAKMYASERLEEYAAVNDERLQERLLHVPDDVWAAAELERMPTLGPAHWSALPKISRALTARRAGRAFAVPVGAGFAVVNAMANYMGGYRGGCREPSVTQELEPVRRDAVWQIGKYLSGVDLYYMHFSNLNKLGVRPCAEVDEEGRCAKIAGFNTPLGIYGYPIAPGFFEREGPRGRIIGGVAWGDVQRPPRTRIRVPFAGERNYVHVFRARQPEHLLWINFMSDDDLAGSGFSAYTTLVGAADRRARLLARVPSPGGFFWYLLREIAEEFEEEEPSVAWARLLRSLGIDGVVDMASEDMTAIIHHNEPMQAVLFKKQDVEQVESMQLRWIQKSVRKTKASAEHAEYAEGAAKQALFDFRHGHLSALQTVHTVHDLFPGDPVLSVEELEEVKAILDHVDQNPETPHGTWQAVMDTWDNVVNGATTLAEAKQRMLAALAATT